MDNRIVKILLLLIVTALVVFTAIFVRVYNTRDFSPACTNQCKGTEVNVYCYPGEEYAGNCMKLCLGEVTNPCE